MPGNNLGDRNVSYIFNSDRLCHIRHLDLSSNGITKDGATMIAESTMLTRLEILDLQNNRIGNDGFFEMVKSQNYPKLVDLRISKN